MTLRAVTDNSVPLAAAFGQVIREARLKAGITQEELAHRSKLHRTYVGYIENGKQSPTLDVVAALAVALEMSAQALIAAAEERTRPQSPRSDGITP